MPWCHRLNMTNTVDVARRPVIALRSWKLSSSRRSSLWENVVTKTDRNNGRLSSVVAASVKWCFGSIRFYFWSLLTWALLTVDNLLHLFCIWSFTFSTVNTHMRQCKNLCYFLAWEMWETLLSTYESGPAYIIQPPLDNLGRKGAGYMWMFTVVRKHTQRYFLGI